MLDPIELDILEQTFKQVRKEIREEENKNTKVHQKETSKKPWWRLLPRETDYRDTGCELYPSCLNCPLPHCAYEEAMMIVKVRTARKAAQVVSLAKQGKNNKEIATMLNLSTRSIQRLKNTRG